MEQITEFLKLFVESGLFMDEIRHGAVSLVFSIIIYRKTNKLLLSLVPIFVTYLVDFDHLVDYFFYYGFEFNAVDYIRMDYFRVTRQAIVPLHAWEWVIALLIFSKRNWSWEKWQFVVALGLTSHLIWDSFTIGNPIFYSIIYRAFNGFVLMI